MTKSHEIVDQRPADTLSAKLRVQIKIFQIAFLRERPGTFVLVVNGEAGEHSVDQCHPHGEP
ncbi:hypothetical protein D3C87_2034070 [compost metagenome]